MTTEHANRREREIHYVHAASLAYERIPHSVVLMESTNTDQITMLSVERTALASSLVKPTSRTWHTEVQTAVHWQQTRLQRLLS